MLKIKRGSVFDEKCDLVVLPCSSRNSVTSWVRSEIEQNNLPFPNAHIPFGHVRFLPTEAHYAKADHVGYAASVDSSTVSSTKDATISIASEAMAFCKQNNCSIANIPILGTGAGRLDPLDVVKIYEEVFSESSVTVNVYTPDRLVLESLAGREGAERATSDQEIDEHPRVFISYSWKDEGVRSWVQDLAAKLCENGVDARLDKFHLKPGMDLPQWMTNEVIKASKVLLVCDTFYAEKADMRKAGVGWETMIIQGNMMLQGELNTKYIVIAYGDFEKNTPIYMKSKLGISKYEVDRDINPLLTHIFDIDIAPEVKKVPDWVKEKRRRKIPA